MRRTFAVLCLCLFLLVSLDPALAGSTEVREIQQSLTDMGYEPGPVDGAWGGKTESAARKFLEDKELNVDSVFSAGGRDEAALIDHIKALKAAEKKFAKETVTRAASALEEHFEDGAVAFKSGDYATALKLWRPLAEQGDTSAQYNLGTIYGLGKGVPQDYAKAMMWHRKAAELGLAQSQRILGSMYRQGVSVPQDYAEAVKWYSKAAEQGDIGAQLSLGTMYSQGQGVPQDNSAAVKWYSKAADQGDTSAQYNLGIMYINGQGAPQDYAMGHKWMNLAAARGDKEAAKYRDDLSKRMTPAQISEAQKLAREWKPKK